MFSHKVHFHLQNHQFKTHLRVYAFCATQGCVIFFIQKAISCSPSKQYKFQRVPRVGCIHSTHTYLNNNAQDTFKGNFSVCYSLRYGLSRLHATSSCLVALLILNTGDQYQLRVNDLYG